MKQLITSNYAPHVNTVVQIERLGESIDVDIEEIAFDLKSGRMEGVDQDGEVITDAECHLAMLEFNEQQRYSEGYEL